MDGIKECFENGINPNDNFIEGQGIVSFSCKELLAIVATVDPEIIITAKTAPEENASVKILKRNGFVFTGMVQDEGIGDAWEWIKAKSEK